MQCQSFTVVVDQRMHAIPYHSHRNRQLPSTIKISQDLVHPHQQVCPSMISAQTLAMLPSRFCLFNLFRHPSSAIASGTLTPEAPGFRPLGWSFRQGSKPERRHRAANAETHSSAISSRNPLKLPENLGSAMATEEIVITRLMKRTKLCTLCTFYLCGYLFVCIRVIQHALSFLCLICLYIGSSILPTQQT